jgi:hypothetical protein
LSLETPKEKTQRLATLLVPINSDEKAPEAAVIAFLNNILHIKITYADGTIEEVKMNTVWKEDSEEAALEITVLPKE